MSTIRIMIVDDHQMIRDGIKSSLSIDPDIIVVQEAASAIEALSKLEDNAGIDVVVMDISLGEGEDGIKTTKTITEQYKHIHILAMSMHDEGAHILHMLKAGATGYILKGQGMNELVEAIKTVAMGENYFSKSVSETLMKQFTRKKNENAGNKYKPLVQLTKREIEVLKLIAEEHSNQEIAEKLFISPRTVDSHRRTLIQKLNVKNTAGLVRYALNHGLTDL